MEVRDAATVMVLRDTPAGRVQVLLQQRNLRSDFVGGVHVFPGGAVDPEDRQLPARFCAGRTDLECSALLGVEGGGLAFWVAAVRECFEEAGVLLARHPGDGQVLSFLDPAVKARFAGHRDAVNAGRPLVEVLEAEGLVLDVGLLHHVSHWVTPEGAPRRYDTRFFVAPAPPEQAPLHDDGETVATMWIEPADALAHHREGDLELILPTIRNLEFLLPFATVEDVMAAARALGPVPTIQPRMAADGDGTGLRIVLPGEPGYELAAPPSADSQPWPSRPGAHDGGLR